jgi:hypothetical protein
MKTLVEAIWIHTHWTRYTKRRRWSELRHRYTVHLPKVLQEHRNLRQLLGLPLPLGLSLPLGLLMPRRQLPQLLSHPLVLGLQHMNRMFQ